ncbi:MAG: polysaccharide deacetylase family protein [Thermoanaerobaculia bacterium]
MVPRAATLVLLALFLAAPPAARADDEPSAVILTYHIVHSPNDTFYSMTRAAFRQQMEYLRSTGYTVISLADLYDYVSGKRESIPKQSVVITVDDGWKCTYTEIFPVMQELGFPFTVFIYPNFIGQSYYALEWDQVVEMAAAGVDIQSHTHSHPFLTRGSDEALERELAKSKKILEEKTGDPVRFVAYPYGDYDARVTAATEKAGYDAGLTCDFGRVHRGSDPFRMKRVVIFEKTSFASFRKLVGAQELKLADAMPAPNGRFDPQSPVVSARITDFEALDPGSVNLAILGMNRVPYSYDPRDGSISVVLREPLPAGRYSAVVWGVESATGKRRDAVWSFTRPEPTAAPLVAASSAPAPAPADEAAAPKRGGAPSPAGHHE